MPADDDEMLSRLPTKELVECVDEFLYRYIGLKGAAEAASALHELIRRLSKAESQTVSIRQIDLDKGGSFPK